MQGQPLGQATLPCGRHERGEGLGRRLQQRLCGCAGHRNEHPAVVARLRGKGWELLGASVRIILAEVQGGA